jgi:hypothetical protein
MFDVLHTLNMNHKYITHQPIKECILMVYKINKYRAEKLRLTERNLVTTFDSISKISKPELAKQLILHTLLENVKTRYTAFPLN